MAKKQKPDQETQKILTEGQKIEAFVSSQDWKLIKEKLFSKLITVDSIASIDSTGMNNDQFIKEVQARAGAVQLVIEWIKEIEGIAVNNRSNQELFQDIRQESIHKYFN